MRKMIAMMLGFAVCFSVTACGGRGDAESGSAETAITVENVGEATADDAVGTMEEGTAAAMEGSAPGGEGAEGSEVLVDHEDCQVVYGGLEYTEDDVRMALSVQNKRHEKTIITIENIALDGVMSGMSEECTLEEGQTEDLVCFIGYDYETVSCGLENKDISMIEFSIRLRDAETYEVFYEDTHVLYPLGEDAAQKKEYVPADTDVVLLDNDVCTISFLRGEEEDGAYYVYLYIENKTDEMLGFEFKKSMVNGISTSVTDSMPQVTAGNAMYYAPSLWCLEEDGITGDIETIEMPVVAYSFNDFSEPAVEETFAITP